MLGQIEAIDLGLLLESRLGLADTVTGEKRLCKDSTHLQPPPLAVLIVRVFTAITISSGPRRHFRHPRAFPSKGKPVLIEALARSV